MFWLHAVLCYRPLLRNAHTYAHSVLILVLLALTSLSAIAALPLPSSERAEFHTDFDRAQQLAKQTGREILIEFSGSDWCTWCSRLREEVLDRECFLKWASKGYVLVNLDFPRGQAARDGIINAARNEELAMLFGIQGFPTIILLSAEGEVLARTSYREGGPKSFIEYLESERSKGLEALKALDPLKHNYEASHDKREALGKIIDKLLTLDVESIGVMGLARIARHALELDPTNAYKLRNRALKALLKTGQAGGETASLASAVDPKNNEGLLELVVVRKLSKLRCKEDIPQITAAIDELHQHGIHDPKVAKELYTAGTFMHLQFHKDKKQAAIYAKKVLELGIENPRAREHFEKIVKDGAAQTGKDL